MYTVYIWVWKKLQDNFTLLSFFQSPKILSVYGVKRDMYNDLSNLYFDSCLIKFLVSFWSSLKKRWTHILFENKEV